MFLNNKNTIFTTIIMLHILKIKGTYKIPDFVQIRDENMSLKAYFRLDQKERGLIKNQLELLRMYHEV